MNRDQAIVQVIEDYPVVGEFLLYNDVDCVNCTIKTCQLKDILAIHNFSDADQDAMYDYMEKLINGQEKEMKKFIPQPVQNEYHPITQMLMDEHKYVKELIYTAEYIIRKKDFMDKYADDIEKLIHYFKAYADDYHHGKEEQLLFNLYPDNEAVKVMLEEHEQGRDYRKTLLSTKDPEVIKQTLKDYGEMLKEHIHKEDDILFPFLDRVLTEEENAHINEELLKNDESILKEVKQYLEDFNTKEFTR